MSRVAICHIEHFWKDRPPMANTDKLKKTIEDLDLQRTAEQLAQLAQQAEQTARQAVAKAGELTHANRDKVDGVIEKVSEAIDLLTKGKAAPHLAKAKAQVQARAEGLPAEVLPPGAQGQRLDRRAGRAGMGGWRRPAGAGWSTWRSATRTG